MLTAKSSFPEALEVRQILHNCQLATVIVQLLPTDNHGLRNPKRQVQYHRTVCSLTILSEMSILLEDATLLTCEILVPLKIVGLPNS